MRRKAYKMVSEELVGSSQEGSRGYVRIQFRVASSSFFVLYFGIFFLSDSDIFHPLSFFPKMDLFPFSLFGRI